MGWISALLSGKDAMQVPQDHPVLRADLARAAPQHPKVTEALIAYVLQ